MKKLFALILAICLSVTVLSALAEEGDVIGYYPDDHPESKVFMSTWVAEGGKYIGLLITGKRKNKGTSVMLREAAKRKDIYSQMQLFETE